MLFHFELLNSRPGGSVSRNLSCLLYHLCDMKQCFCGIGSWKFCVPTAGRGSHALLEYTNTTILPGELLLCLYVRYMYHEWYMEASARSVLLKLLLPALRIVRSRTHLAFSTLTYIVRVLSLSLGYARPFWVLEHPCVPYTVICRRWIKTTPTTTSRPCALTLTSKAAPSFPSSCSHSQQRAVQLCALIPFSPPSPRCSIQFFVHHIL